MKNKICTECGHIGKPIPQNKSSFSVDVIIWFYFIFLTASSQLLPLLLAPIAWSLYHLVMFNRVKCPQCGNLEMVGLHSHSGKEKLENPHPVTITRFKIS